MKKIITLLFISFSLSAFSQIKVLQNISLLEVGKEDGLGLYKKDNKYSINYQDVNAGNLNTFRTFSFMDVNKDFDTLYKMISDGFISMPNPDISLELPGDIINLHFEKNYGQPTMQFIQYINKNKKFIGKSQFYTKAQIDRIFGKRAYSGSTSVSKISKK